MKTVTDPEVLAARSEAMESRENDRVSDKLSPERIELPRGLGRRAAMELMTNACCGD